MAEGCWPSKLYSTLGQEKFLDFRRDEVEVPKLCRPPKSGDPEIINFLVTLVTLPKFNRS